MSFREALIDEVVELEREAKHEALAVLSKFKHVLHRVRFAPKGSTSDGTEPEPEIKPVVDIDDANAISSQLALSPGMHTIAIDLDVPAQLVPSSTPGHSHLYIDVAMPWEAYLDVLRALAVAGVVEPGYVAASERRGHTTLRLPWVKKQDGDESSAKGSA